MVITLFIRIVKVAVVAFLSSLKIITRVPKSHISVKFPKILKFVSLQ